jgi:N-acetylglucosamine kinase
MFVIGIDGGGTRAVGTIADLDGTIRETVRMDPIYYRDSDQERIGDLLRRSVLGLLQRTGTEISGLSGVCVGLNGLVRPEDWRAVSRQFSALDLDQVPLVVKQPLIGLVGGILSDTGINVVANEDGLVVAKGTRGKVCEVGGYGPLISDEGGAYSLARNALRAVLRAQEEREQPTTLTNGILRRLRLRNPEEIRQWVDWSGGDPQKTVPLADLVFEAWAEGDGVARQIAEQGAQNLAEMAQYVYGRAGFPGRTDVVLTGSLFDRQPLFFELTSGRIKALLPQVEVIRPRMSPVIGGVLYAMAQAGTAVSGTTLGNLMRSWNDLASRSSRPSQSPA